MKWKTKLQQSKITESNWSLEKTKEQVQKSLARLVKIREREDTYIWNKTENQLQQRLEDKIRLLNTILLFSINLKTEFMEKFLGKYKLYIKN